MKAALHFANGVTSCLAAPAWVPDGPTAVQAARLPTVLFVHQSSDLYGSDRVLLATACALQRAGGHAIVVLPGAGPLQEALREAGIEVHVLTEWAVLKLSRKVMTWRGLCHLLASVGGSLQALDRCLAGRRADLVVSNTLAVLAGVPWARRQRLPHLWHVHEIVEHPRWAARAFPWLLRWCAQRVVCNSEATQRWLLAAQPALAARTQVVWNGAADPQAVPASQAAQQLHAAFRPQGVGLAIGLIGRINRMKGHGLLLQAAQLLRLRGINDFALVFIGDAPAGQPQHLQTLQQQIADSGLAGRVVCTGFMPHTAAAYAALDIVCVPSTEAESFGMVAIEAMAMGLPVVASAVGGLPDVVQHLSTGLLHRAGDFHALAEQLGRLLLDPALRSALGQSGRKRYCRVFAADTVNRHMVAALTDAALLNVKVGA